MLKPTRKRKKAKYPEIERSYRAYNMMKKRDFEVADVGAERDYAVNNAAKTGIEPLKASPLLHHKHLQLVLLVQINRTKHYLSLYIFFFETVDVFHVESSTADVGVKSRRNFYAGL